MKKTKFINLFLIFGFILTCKSFVYAGRGYAGRDGDDLPTSYSYGSSTYWLTPSELMSIEHRIDLRLLGHSPEWPFFESTQNRNAERNSRNNNSTVLNPNLNNNRRGNDVLKLNNNGNRDDVGATCEHDQISGLEKGCLNIN